MVNPLAKSLGKSLLLIVTIVFVSGCSPNPKLGMGDAWDYISEKRDFNDWVIVPRESALGDSSPRIVKRIAHEQYQYGLIGKLIRRYGVPDYYMIRDTGKQMYRPGARSRISRYPPQPSEIYYIYYAYVDSGLIYAFNSVSGDMVGSTSYTDFPKGVSAGKGKMFPLPDSMITAFARAGRARNLTGEELSAERQKAGSVDDKEPPKLRITKVSTEGSVGVITGIATDDVRVAQVLVDQTPVKLNAKGYFTFSTFIPRNGIEIAIQAFDLSGRSVSKLVPLKRSEVPKPTNRLSRVNPLNGPKQRKSSDRVALIIGIEEYKSAQDAKYSARDASMFADFAQEKLGILPENTQVLTNSRAGKSDILRAIKVWLPTVVVPNVTELFVFYAGHGMPAADGKSAFIVPHDGDVELLADTAVSRQRFFEEIKTANPRLGIFFFDNCYSGATRSENLLLASRPLSIRVDEPETPENFTIFSAGEADQTAGVIEEVRHGRFSYFLFKGLEGLADADEDKKVTAEELHAYLMRQVGRFSAGSQRPTLFGNKNQVILR